jgi:thiol-disulfide isomerase/thioredoxin
VDVLGLLAVVGALVLATVVGLVLRARSGRVRTGTATGGWALAERTPSAHERVLLLQLSSPVCAPCRRTAAVLAGLATGTAGVVHVEVDVAEHPEVARSLHVLRTPTTVAFDRAGGELLRVGGVPRVTELASALAPALITGTSAPESPDPQLPSSP